MKINKILVSFLAGATALSSVVPAMALEKVDNDVTVEYNEAEVDAEVVFHIGRSCGNTVRTYIIAPALNNLQQ